MSFVVEPIRIVALSVAAAVLYGLIHDQITAHVCVEYFSIGHPPIFETEDPTLLALGWGVIATWWVGLMLGVPLAVVARWGSRPKVAPRELVRPIAQLLGAMGLAAAVVGTMSWILTARGLITPEGAMELGLSRERWVPFTAVERTHSASYLAGFLGGVIVILRVWRNRRQGSTGGRSPGE
jgi:hypothetical protein